jgi:hypothetical protein
MIIESTKPDLTTDAPLLGMQCYRLPLVNSLSGGKTSSYMAKHYPADYNVFALVRIEANYCKPKDESIVKYVSDKIGMDFIATAESDITLYLMRDLEQVLGKEIKWVTGETFDQVIRNQNCIPNMFKRFCTKELKVKPIFEWWQQNFEENIQMNIGYRYDEIERGYEKKDDKTFIKKEEKPFKIIVGKHSSGRNKWKKIYWRKEQFPLIDEKITHWKVYKWAIDTGLIFPKDSNCAGCFWKPEQQIRKNFEDEPLKMRWFKEKEIEMKRRWKNEHTYSQIEKYPLQLDFFFGTGSGCQAGFCTD